MFWFSINIKENIEEQLAQARDKQIALEKIFQLTGNASISALKRYESAILEQRRLERELAKINKEEYKNATK